MSPLFQIFRAVDNRLASLAESYERMPSGDPDRFPALAVYDNGDSPIESETGSQRLSLGITVEGYVEGYEGAATHDALNDLHASAVASLCADGANLAGLVELIEIAGQRRVDVADLASKKRLGFAQDFEIQYVTARGDPGTSA